MKKVAIFQTDLNYGGIQKSIINLLNNIDLDKYEIDLYLFEKNNIFIDEIPKKINIIYMKKAFYLTRIVNFKILNKMYKNKINKEYDVAIDFNSYSMDTSLAAVNVKSKKKIIWVHNDIDIKLKEETKYRILHHFFKFKYEYFDTFVAVSEGALDSFKKYHYFKDKEYITIPNMIDTSEIIKKAKEKSNIKVDDDVYNLVSLGRLCHQKGFDLLLVYISELLKVRNDFHLYIVGDGKEKVSIEKQINDLNLQDYVTLCGYAKNPYAILNKMDGFVLTSRYEGQGMVFLEAKCLGLNIVMPKHLEKYVDEVKGTDDIVLSLSKLKKQPKKMNDLKKYNDDIIKKINNVLK